MAPPSPSSFPLDSTQVVALVCAAAQSHSRGHLLAGYEDPRQAVVQLVGAALSTGALDLATPVTQKGEGALVAWDALMPKGLPAHLLRQAARLYPGMGPANNHGPAMVQAMANMRLAHDAPAASRVLAWVEVSSAQAILSMDKPAQAPGQGFLDWMSRNRKGLTKNFQVGDWTAMVEVLAEKGIDWINPAMVFPSVLPSRLLEALCRRGLDLSAQEQGAALWRRLLEFSRPSIAQVLARHAPAVDDAAVRASQVATYLARFSDLAREGRQHGRAKAGATATHRKGVLAHLLSRHDWPALADHHGRSAFFHAVMASPGILRHAVALASGRESATQEEQRQWARALAHSDRAGRGLWFYILACRHDPTFTQNLVNALRDHAPGEPDWAERLLLDPPASMAALTLPGDLRPMTSLPALQGWRPAPWWAWVYGPALLPDEPSRMETMVANALRFPKLCHDITMALPAAPGLAAAQAWSMVLYHGPKGLQDQPHLRDRFDKLMAQVRTAPGQMVFPIDPQAFSHQRRAIKQAPTQSQVHDLDILEKLALRARLERISQPASSWAGRPAARM